MSSASSSPPSNPDNRIEAEMASKALKELKKTLRAHVDGLVQQLSQAEVRVQSEAITQHILSHPSFKQAQNVGIYASFPEHEASTVDLARQILRQGVLTCDPGNLIHRWEDEASFQIAVLICCFGCLVHRQTALCPVHHSKFTCKLTSRRSLAPGQQV